MSNWILEVVGTVEDAFGEEIEVCVEWNADASAADEDDRPRITIRGEGDIELSQEGAEEFGRLFVRACWEAAARRPVAAEAVSV